MNNMATTFDVNRIGGGTFELVQDPATGRYSYKKVGFTPVKSLTIPELGKTTTAATDTAAAAKSATEQTVKQQTTEVFRPTGGGRGRDIDYTGDMLKEASKINPQLQMTRNNLTSSFIGEERPTKTYSEQLADLQRGTAQGDAFANARRAMTQPGMTDKATVYDPYGIRVEDGRFSYDMNKTSVDDFKKTKTTAGSSNPRRPGQGTLSTATETATLTGVNPGAGDLRGFSKNRTTARADTPMTSSETVSDDQKRESQLGISRVESTQPTIGSFGTDPTAANRFRGVSQMGALAGEGEKEDVKPEPTALKKVSTGLKSLSNAVGSVLSSGPISMIAKAITKEPSNIQQLNKDYFNVRDDGRIAGNPATDLYAGFNRTSDFGNLEQAGKKRISTREKTIARKNYGPGDKFYDDTQKMKEQQKDYQRKKAEKQKATQGPAGGATTGGGGGGSDSGSRVICTDLHRTGELSTRDWIRDTKFTFKKLSIQHVKGYLLWAEPTVRHIQKYPRYRKIWKHIAQHRANDIAWRLNEGKFDLLGRIYAGIGEPLCWMLGNFVSDKQINKYNLSHWRRV